MDPISNDVLGQVLRYTAFICVCITSIVGCVYMLRPKPDLMSVATEMRKAIGEFKTANSTEHGQFKTDVAVGAGKVTDLESRLQKVEATCPSHREKISEVEGKAHARIDSLAIVVGQVNGKLDVISGQLGTVVEHLISGR